MLDVKKNVSLVPYTTLQIAAVADYFVVVNDKEDFFEAITWAKEKELPILVLGGGSNIMFSKRYRGLVIKNELKGIRVLRRNQKSAIVESLSGELWSAFVNYGVENNLYGVENLFLIPGTVGAAPIQNIGAYGVELKDVFYSLTAINLKTGQEKIFKLADCNFSYRESVFKKGLKGKYFVYSVAIRLKTEPAFNLGYGLIKEKLLERGIKKVMLRDVVQVIQDIRNAKIPNPLVLPNAGSFFKNPIISKTLFKRIQKDYPDIPHYQVAKKIKLPAAWLIEQAGFKGKKFKGVGMYEKQALILINYDNAKYNQVKALSLAIKKKVKEMFGLDLEEEINII